jgi:hypothetical protein
MNSKEYKKYLENKKLHLKKVDVHYGMTKYIRKLNSEFNEPILDKINAKFKQTGVYELEGWHLYPSSALAMHKKTFKKLSLYDFVEKYINPDKKKGEEYDEGFVSKSKLPYEDTFIFIYCCGCKKKIQAILKKKNKKWRYYCECGLHINTDNNKDYANPIGYIPTKKIRNAQQHLNNLIDTFCKDDIDKKIELFNYVQEKTKSVNQFNPMFIKNVNEGRRAYKIMDNYINKDLVNVKRI